VKISKSNLSVGLAIAVLTMASVHAQPYPAKPVRVIVPFPAGGSADTLARIAATKLSERWAQQVVVDNRGGAGGNIGADVLAKSPPDGHTLMMGTVALAISAGLYRKLPFDVAKDFAPVTLVASVPMILVVHPSVPAKSVQELIALAKRQPGTLTFASAGNGTPSHLAGELFAKSAEVRMVHVPYKGGAPAVVDLLGGQVSLMLDNSLSVPGYIKGGKLRALGVSTRSRNHLLPEVPTISEAGVAGYDFNSWFGVFAPARTNEAIIAKVHGDLRDVLALPDVQEKLRNQGAEPVGRGPQQFAELFKRDVTKLGQLISDIGLQVD
jgi:tripartite-type tricarboxylate transporter receptor subunit TctC